MVTIEFILAHIGVIGVWIVVFVLGTWTLIRIKRRINKRIKAIPEPKTIEVSGVPSVKKKKRRRVIDIPADKVKEIYILIDKYNLRDNRENKYNVWKAINDVVGESKNNKNTWSYYFKSATEIQIEEDEK